MGTDQSAVEQELESLLQFLYTAPIGLVQASMDGEILLINAKSAQVLLPLAPRGELANLFDVFEDLAPDLRLRAESHGPACGPVFQNLPLRIAGSRTGPREPQVLDLTLLKLDAERLIAVVGDISRDPSAEGEAGDPLRRIDIDQLTGLANRWAFFEAAEAGCTGWLRAATPQPLALAVFDVDPLPAPPAERGRPARDAALRHAAAHLAAAVEPGVRPARIGEGRFAVLLPRLLPAAVQARVDRICRAIAEAPPQLDGVSLPTVRVRAGIAAMHADVTGIDDLLERAGAALRGVRTRESGPVDRSDCLPAGTR